MRLRNLLQSRFLRLEIEEQNQMLECRVAERTRQLEDALSDLKSAQRADVAAGTIARLCRDGGRRGP